MDARSCARWRLCASRPASIATAKDATSSRRTRRTHADDARIRFAKGSLMAAWRRFLLVCIGIAGLNSASAQESTIRIGMARSTSNAAELMAIEKGYFREYGIR